MAKFLGSHSGDFHTFVFFCQSKTVHSHFFVEALIMVMIIRKVTSEFIQRITVQQGWATKATMVKGGGR